MRPRLLLLLSLASLAACSAEDDSVATDDTDMEDTDGSSNTEDTNRGSDTDDGSGTDTDTTDTDATDTDTSPAAAITWEASHPFMTTADLGSVAAAEVTVTCGSDGYGFGYTGEFGSGSFVRITLPWFHEGQHDLDYIPQAGFLYRLPTNSDGSNADWGNQANCLFDVTAPQGLGGMVGFEVTCDGFDAVYDGQTDESTIRLDVVVDGTACTEPSSMQTCDDWGQPDLVECLQIPLDACDDFMGCSVGECDPDHALCSGYANSTSCSAANDCFWNAPSQACETTAGSSCWSITDASECGAQAGCAWDPYVCVGQTTCGELEEAACAYEFGCDPTY